MAAGAPLNTVLPKEDANELIGACARACGVSPDLVEGIYPASQEQYHRMEHHKSTGSYMMQMVLRYEGILNEDFLLRALSAIRFKNQILRTRLTIHQGKVYQVVLNDSIRVRKVLVSLDNFLALNSQIRMDYGTSLFRYDLFQQIEGESFIIWSAHRSAVDAWTLRLMFDELREALSGLQAYWQLPTRASYGHFAELLESHASTQIAQVFWLTFHAPFDNLVHNFPLLGPGTTLSVSTKRFKKLMYLPKVENPEFPLQTMGYAAWALTIASLRQQNNLPLQSEDVSFLSMIPARRSTKPDITQMMGPLSACIPLRLHVAPNLSMEFLMRDIDAQFSWMGRMKECVEQYAIKALSNRGAFQNTFKQAVFDWNQVHMDITSINSVCNDKEVAPATLEYREDLSMASTHDYGLLFEVHDHGEYLVICLSWDHNLIADGDIFQLLVRFERIFLLMITTPGLTVQELL